MKFVSKNRHQGAVHNVGRQNIPEFFSEGYRYSLASTDSSAGFLPRYMMGIFPRKYPAKKSRIPVGFRINFTRVVE